MPLCPFNPNRALQESPVAEWPIPLKAFYPKSESSPQTLSDSPFFTLKPDPIYQVSYSGDHF